MRLLITGTTYYPALNGQSIFMVNLAEGLACRGHEVAVLFPDPHSPPRVQNGVRLEPVRSLDMRFIHNESYWPVFFTRQVRRVFDSLQPEIVHIQDHYPLSYGVVHEARRRGLRILGTNHYSPASLEPYIPAARWIKPLLDRILWEWMLYLYRRLDFVTAPSPAAVNVLHAQGLRVPSLAVSCGTDLRRFHPDPSVDRLACRRRYGLDPQRKLFLYVGRVDQEKRIDVLLQALHLLPRRDLQLAIAGQGAALDHLQGMARSFELGDRVRFIGAVKNEDLNELLNSADVFAMAGEAESLSIASLEAMASGLPMLLADAFALPQLVTAGGNGYLFRSGDPQDAARYMNELAEQAGRWEEMGRLSIEKVRPHSLDDTISRYETLYAQVRDNVPVPQGSESPSPRRTGSINSGGLRP
jgi:glycosyltransferase involved in cell wall biosynthesis